VLGLLFAVLILRLSQREGGIFRLILYSPAMLPTAVVGIMFVFFFNPEMGLLNNFLRLVGLGGLQHVWLQEKGTAMACIIFVAIWKCAGSVMMLTFAALQGVPRSLYESSYLDGAGFMQQMRKIGFPLIKPMILLATINTLGAQFKSYDLIFTMTQGGPADLTTTVPIVMKKTAFIYGSFGSAAAMGVLFTIVVAVSILLIRWCLRGETYEY
jgi:raffinose/stachyose/melibiose transport system permease protein